MEPLGVSVAVDPVWAGALLGAAGMAVFVFVVARWGYALTRLVSGLRDAWTYVRITAVGTVTVRHGSVDDHGCLELAEETKLRKGEFERLSFAYRTGFQRQLYVELPAIYKLQFPEGSVEHWSRAEITDDGRCIYRTAPRSAQEEGGMRSTWVTVVVVTALQEKAGWRGVRDELGKTSWACIAARGRQVSTLPEVYDPAEHGEAWVTNPPIREIPDASRCSQRDGISGTRAD